MSKDEDKSETPGSEFVFFHSANVIGFAFKAPFDLQLDEESAIELEDKIHDFFNDLLKDKFKDYEHKENNAETSSTQPTYQDSSGRIFTPSDIVGGYRPKGKYKGYSISAQVSAWKPTGQTRKKTKSKK